MKRTVTTLGLVALATSTGCTGNDPGKQFFDAEVVTDIPENATTISYSSSEASENDELRSIINETVHDYKLGGLGRRAEAASPRAVERFEDLPTTYIVYRNETVHVTVYEQS